MKITYLGHSSLLIEVNDKHIIVDPFITENELAKDIKVEELKADYILLTHAHQDHILDTELIAKNTGATIVSNFEITNYYEKKGFKVHPMNHGGGWTFDFGYLKYVIAIHTSSFPDGTYGGQPGGFIISANEKNIYIAGDTALTMDMKLIPIRYPLNLAILPIGGNFTMDVDDATIAAEYLEVNEVLGCHYDTFGYIKIDHELAEQKFLNKSKKLRLLEIGQAIEI